MQIPRLYKRPSRRNWRIEYYDETNRRREVSTGTEDEKSALLELARFIEIEEEERLSVAPFVVECLEYYSERHETKGSYKVQNDKNIISFFGKIPANSISRNTCRSYIKFRTNQEYKRTGWKDSKSVSVDTAGREIRALAAAINFCVKEKFCPSGAAFYYPTIQSKGKKHITKEEARLIFSQCPSFHIKLFMLIALGSGHRMSAILGLTWARVSAGTINFIDPNRAQTNKRRGQVPIIEGSDLYYMLSEARAAAQTDYVVEHNGKPVKSVRHAIEVAGQRVGIDYLTPHILKHSACVWMAEDGVPLADIADLTVTDIKTIMDNYMIFTPARGQRAVSATQF